MKNAKAWRGLVAMGFATSAVMACGEHTIDLWADETPIAAEALDSSVVTVLPDNSSPPPFCPTQHELVLPGAVDAGVTDAADAAVESSSGTRCGLRGAVCEYGGSADPACTTTYTCGVPSATWQQQPPKGRCYESICPKDVAVSTLDDTPCSLAAGTDEDEAICTVSDGVCACTTGRGGADHHERRWRCTRPIVGCRIERPSVGQPCVGSLVCDYGSCRSKRGTAMKCESGVWQATSFACE